jgi:hypothetical protein
MMRYKFLLARIERVQYFYETPVDWHPDTLVGMSCTLDHGGDK